MSKERKQRAEQGSVGPARSGDLAIMFTYVLQVRKRIDFFMIERERW